MADGWQLISIRILQFFIFWCKFVQEFPDLPFKDQLLAQPSRNNSDFSFWRSLALFIWSQYSITTAGCPTNDCQCDDRWYRQSDWYFTFTSYLATGTLAAYPRHGYSIYQVFKQISNKQWFLINVTLLFNLLVIHMDSELIRQKCGPSILCTHANVISAL
jgi:hypothetical protein